MTGLQNIHTAKISGYTVSELQVADSFTNFLASVDIRAFSHWFFLALTFFTPQVFLFHYNCTENFYMNSMVGLGINH